LHWVVKDDPDPGDVQAHALLTLFIAAPHKAVRFLMTLDFDNTLSDKLKKQGGGNGYL
jgi:hypothetical protein